jgi:hypothetical protein
VLYDYTNGNLKYAQKEPQPGNMIVFSDVDGIVNEAMWTIAPRPERPGKPLSYYDNSRRQSGLELSGRDRGSHLYCMSAGNSAE